MTFCGNLLKFPGLFHFTRLRTFAAGALTLPADAGVRGGREKFLSGKSFRGRAAAALDDKEDCGVFQHPAEGLKGENGMTENTSGDPPQRRYAAA